ncbi:EscU/YscU/HrcU family type III secretion system export apparatus switch protein [bacterium]|nr:EscU/YscU/HrcU family type III secretion system export apparatus switch protein [bacterium]
MNSTKKEKVAIALDYSAGENAPKVSCIGRGKVSQEMTRTALRYGVPIEESQQVVKQACKLQSGKEIPEELYEEVAKLLVEIEKYT